MLSHNADKPYVCGFCDKTFKSKYSLNAHVTTIHKGVMPMLECNVCGKECKGRAALKRHKLKLHVNATYKCDKCLKTFLNKRNFNEHACNNTPICKICGTLFASTRALNRHLIGVHTDIKCKTCGKCFSCLEDLFIHRDTVLCRKDHTCPKCGNVFYDLKKHMQTHAEDKPSRKAVVQTK